MGRFVLHLKDGNFSYPEISVKIVRKLAKRAVRKMIDQSNLPRNNMVERRYLRGHRKIFL